MKKKDIDIVKENYDNNAHAEWERLEGFHFEFEAQFFEFGNDGFGEVVVDLLARLFGFGYFLFDLVVCVGMFVFECEVFQFGFDGKET